MGKLSISLLCLTGMGRWIAGRAIAVKGIELISGMVSAAALEAGGYVHGIIPESLVERASQTGNGLKSGEGQGVDILDNDYDGRFTTEITRGMHEVCSVPKFLEVLS